MNIKLHYLEANLRLLIKTLQGVWSVDLRVISTATGMVRVVLLLLLSWFSIRILGHGVDLPLRGVEHDGENLQVPQQPQLAETSAFAALPHQQLCQS